MLAKATEARILEKTTPSTVEDPLREGEPNLVIPGDERRGQGDSRSPTEVGAQAQHADAARRSWFGCDERSVRPRISKGLSCCIRTVPRPVWRLRRAHRGGHSVAFREKCQYQVLQRENPALALLAANQAGIHNHKATGFLAPATTGPQTAVASKAP